MIENYSFNELYKRFEPLEKQCTYRGSAQVTDIDHCYYIPLFMTKDSTNLIVYRSVKFAKILIGIPRCESCKEIHRTSSIKAACVAWGSAVMLLFILFYNLVFFGGIVAALGVFASLFIGDYGTQYLQDRFVVNSGLYSLKDGAETNEIIRDLVLSGWSLEQPAP